MKLAGRKKSFSLFRFPKYWMFCINGITTVRDNDYLFINDKK